MAQQVPLIRREEPLIQAEEPAWQQLTDREFRKMAIEQMEQVGVAWSIDVELYLRSALIPDYSPVLDYLGNCGTWDGQTDVPSIKKLTLALKACHFPYGKMHGVRGWYARRTIE